MKTHSGKAKKGTALRVVRYLKPFLPGILVLLLIATGSVILSLFFPLLVGNMIDSIVSGDHANLRSLLFRGIAVVLTVSVLQWLMSRLVNRISYGTVYRLRADAFQKIQSLPLSYIDAHPSGEIVSRIITDTDQFTDGLLLGFSQFFTGVLTIVGTIGFMLSIHISVTLVVVLVTPLSLFVAAFIAKKTHRLFLSQSETRAEETAFADELIAGHKTVLAFGHEDEANTAFAEINERLRKTSLSALFYSSLTNPATRFVNNLVYAGVAVTGAMICILSQGSEESLTVGALSCFLTYANQYTKPFNEISGVITELQNALASADRLFALLDESPESPDPESSFSPDSVNGNIELQDVSFAYRKDQKLIRNFNLTLKSGQRAAIVGPTGCGKTTVINLLMRFYDPDSGEIRIDGQSTREIPRKSVRATFGMVLQETWLSHGTVRENLCFGKPDATEEEMVNAARAAHADSFIRKLPKGYDTVIGEDGGTLSQGQKQLLCIARVMLALPPMLILDEATSSIDTRTELKIQNAFAAMMKGRTSFIVAHRLSTIEDADVILVMRNGNIVEQGSHAELLEKNGFYAELYSSQFES